MANRRTTAAKLPDPIEVLMMKPRADGPAFSAWVRRDGAQLSTYGVGEDGTLATRHETITGDARARWDALVDERRRAGYHRITKDPAGTLAFLRQAASLHGLALQITLAPEGGSRVDVTAACERWAGEPGPKSALIARLLDCHLDRTASMPAAVALASAAHRYVAGEPAPSLDEPPRRRLTSPLLAVLVEEGTPARGRDRFADAARLAPAAMTLAVGFR